MYGYGMTFTSTCLTVFSGMTALIGFSEGTGTIITNTIITILAGAVAILWKKIDKHYRDLDAENKAISSELKLVAKRNDDCEDDRRRLQFEIDQIKKAGCSLSENCNKRTPNA